MMTDSENELVKRLRLRREDKYCGHGEWTDVDDVDCYAAADAIERLVRERDEARAERDKLFAENASIGNELFVGHTDLVLRAEAAEAEVQKWHGDAVRLQYDNIRLREALQGIAENPTRCGETNMTRTPTCVRADAARKVLEAKHD